MRGGGGEGRGGRRRRKSEKMVEIIQRSEGDVIIPCTDALINQSPAAT